VIDIIHTTVKGRKTMPGGIFSKSEIASFCEMGKLLLDQEL